jgi:ribosome-associated heat shock protein Hsp15
MRIDRLLWFLRLVKTRPLAQALIGEGHVRLNTRRIERPAHKVCVGDVLTLPLAGGVRVIEVLALPLRRGPAAEAQSCYRVLDEVRPNPIAAGNVTGAASAAKGEDPA